LPGRNPYIEQTWEKISGIFGESGKNQAPVSAKFGHTGPEKFAIVIKEATLCTNTDRRTPHEPSRPAFHRELPGDPDQRRRVLCDLKHDPASRRILISIYNFQDLHEMNLYPCAYSMTFNVSGNTLNAILNQRSQDMLTANNWNVVQYAVLVHMLARASGLVPGELVHVIADAHIYDRHVPLVKKLLERTPGPAPVFSIDLAVTDFYGFTADSFRVENYTPAPFDDKIPVAV